MIFLFFALYNKKQASSLLCLLHSPNLGQRFTNKCIDRFIYFMVYCALTLQLSLKRMFLSEMIYACRDNLNMCTKEMILS